MGVVADVMKLTAIGKKSEVGLQLQMRLNFGSTEVDWQHRRHCTLRRYG